MDLLSDHFFQHFQWEDQESTNNNQTPNECLVIKDGQEEQLLIQGACFLEGVEEFENLFNKNASAPTYPILNNHCVFRAFCEDDPQNQQSCSRLSNSVYLSFFDKDNLENVYYQRVQRSDNVTPETMPSQFLFDLNIPQTQQSIIAIPRAKLPFVGQTCFIVGYPIKKTHTELLQWIDQTYFKEDNLNSVLTYESKQHVLTQLSHLIPKFFMPDCRNTTVGKVLEFNEGIIKVDAASFPGMIGGACFDEEGRLLGFNLDPLPGMNCNRVLSVYHPAFIHGYSSKVIKTLTQEQLKAADEYIQEIADVNKVSL